MKKSILCSLFIFLTLSCESPDDDPPPPPPTNPIGNNDDSGGDDDNQPVGDTSTAEDVLFDGMVIFETDEKSMPLIFQNIEGSSVTTLDENEDGIIDAFEYFENGVSAKIEFDNKTLLPTKVSTSNGEVVLYSFNEDRTLVDIAVLKDDNVSFVREINVTIPPDLNAEISNKLGQKNSTDTESIRNAALKISLVINGASCALEIISGIGIPVAVFNCSVFAASVFSFVTEKTDSEILNNVNNGINHFATLSDIAQCGNGIGPCVSFLLGLAADRLGEIENEVENISDQSIQDANNELINFYKINLSGDLTFGEVLVGSTAKKVLTISNPSKLQGVTILNIEIPDGYSSNWINGTIEPESTQDIEISFTPLEQKEYSGDILISLQSDIEDYKTSISGYGLDSESFNFSSDVGAIEAILSINGVNTSSISDWLPGDNYVYIEYNGQNYFAGNIETINGRRRFTKARFITTTFISPEITRLSALKDLSIGGANQGLPGTYHLLTDFPDYLGELGNLETLSIKADEGLSTLPNSIGNLSQLESFFLNGGNVTELPESIGNLSRLENLYINSALTQLPATIGNLTNLSTLDLSQNQINILPDRIGDLANLEYLNLNYNKLDILPQEFKNLSRVKQLNLNYNEFESFPLEITELYSLNDLHIAGNSIIELPLRFMNLQNLINLTLSDCDLIDIPTYFELFEELYFLDISKNNLINLPEELGELSLTYFYIQDNGLNCLPINIWDSFPGIRNDNFWNGNNFDGLNDTDCSD